MLVKTEIHGGAAIAAVRFGSGSMTEETSPAAWVGGMPGRKVRTPKGAVVGNAHRPVPRCAAWKGTVPQKIDRLGRIACDTPRGKGETAR